MNKMVDMQKAFDAVYKYFHLRNAIECTRLYKALEEAYELTKLAESEWFSDEYKLPEDGQIVWITIKHGETYVVKTGFWSAEDKCWCDGDFGFHLVDQPIAWMEIDIPHPYEGSEDD